MNTKIAYDKFLVYTASVLFLTWVTISIISTYVTPRYKTTDKGSKDLDEIRPAPKRDVQLFQDPKNNCEYVVTSRGGIHPRLSPDGLQLGCTEDAADNLENEELQ